MKARLSATARRFTGDKPLVLDGGLATELERRGHDLADPLWSAKVLVEHPEAVEQVHFDYLAAGADIIATASYQATIPGMLARGMSRNEAADVLRRSVTIAEAARERFLQSTPNRERPLVAASIGPYGAMLANGAEYHGNYGLSLEQLADFHRERLAILAETDADLFACETIPSLAEAQALIRVLSEFPNCCAWISFSCRDAAHTAHGEPLEECAKAVSASPQVLAIGVNCLPPSWAADAVAALARGTFKPIVVYPNSGKRWDAGRRTWVGETKPEDFLPSIKSAHRSGAVGFGGCCRTGPAHIRQLRQWVDALPA